ncbi:MAG TPA: GNAT family N-acetyltransferase [Paludibacter sp.]
MPVIIRQIQETDNAPLAKLIRKVFREFKIDMPGTVYTDPTTDKLFELFQAEKSVYWVAEENGKLLGGCGIFPTAGLPKGCAELVKFYLSPHARGGGIGRLLMQVSNNTARSLGYEQLYLESFPQLEGAVSIYLKQGFEYLDAPLGNSGHHACTIWMVKEL